MPVIATGKFDDLAPSGEGPREPDRGHGGFGPRIDKPEHLDRRHPVGNLRRQSHFALGRRAEGPAMLQLGADRLDDSRRALTQDQRSPGADEIQVSTPIDIKNPRAVTPGDEGRVSPDRAIGSDRAVDAARDQALCLLEQRGRPLDAYDGSRSMSRSKASCMTAASRVGAGLPRRARTCAWRTLALGPS